MAAMRTMPFINSLKPCIQEYTPWKTNPNNRSNTSKIIIATANITPVIAPSFPVSRSSLSQIMTIICIFAFNNDVCIPIYAREVLQMDSGAYTTLMSTTGLGSFLGACYMSGRAANGINSRILKTGIITLTGTQILLFFNSNYILAILGTIVVGFSIIVYLNMANSIFQLHTEEAYLGRVMSVYSFMDCGLAPVGSFYSGTLMETAGGVYGFLGCGLGTLLALGLAYVAFKRSFQSWSPELD